jgi:membrane peptidoglycan carboxypeptidase
MTSISEEGRGALLHRSLLVLMVSTLAGLLFAGAMFPLVGGVGLMARAGANSFIKLPEVLIGEDLPLPIRSRILAADGSLLATVYFNENRIIAPLKDVPAVMQRALIAIEDQRFYQHDGVDYRGLLRAMVKNQREGEVTQGGSTITQQYVKNVLIESAADDGGRKAATEQKIGRKLREARYALALEKRYTKDQILEKYLNIAYFGQGVYGVATAAQHYFGKPVGKLTTDEAAFLAGLVQNPTKRDPVKNPVEAKKRRDTVLKVMAEQGFITTAEEAAFRAKPLRVVKSTLVNECGRTLAPFFCAYVRDAILDDDRFTGGADKQERIARLYQGGLTIRTSLDPRIQRAAQAAVTSVLTPADARRAAAVATIVEPGTGLVRAIASNQTFGEAAGQTQINHALGGSTGFQAGSTFKVFFLAAAIKQGIPLSLRLPAPRTYTTRKPGFLNNGQPYSVDNYGGSAFGVVDMARATWNSMNTYYLQLAERTGLEAPMQLAEQMGLNSWELPKRGSSVLGVASVSPLEMTEAYATFAARGLHCPATGIVDIRDAEGGPVYAYDRTESCKQVLEKEDADAVNAVLQGVVTNGTGKGAQIGRPVAGKTGTSQSNATAWFIGYSPQLAGALYMGHPKLPVKFPLKGFPGAPRGVTGGSLPATMWKRMMGPAHEGLPVTPFVKPSGGAYLGEVIPVPDVRGFSVEDALATLTAAGFDARLDPRPARYTGIERGRVGLTSPRGGARVPVGSQVLVFASDGSDPLRVPTVIPSPSASPSPSRSVIVDPPSPSPTSGPGCKPRKSCTTPTPTPTPSPTPSASASKAPPPAGASPG